jgi:HlyD family secretion protein
MPTSQRKWTGIVIGTVVVIVVLIGLAGRDKPPLVQVTAVVRQALVSSISSNGKIEPIQPFVLRAQMDTFVREVHATEGQAVRRGEMLLTLDDADFRAQLAQARADLVAEQAQLRAAQAGGPPDQVAQLDGDVRKAQIDVDRLQTTQKALEALVAEKAATQAELEKNKSDLAAAQATLAALEKRRQALATTSSTDADKFKLRIEQLQNQIQSLEGKVNSARVVAPADGTLYSLPVHSGDYVHTGDVLAELADLHQIRVRAYVDEPDLGWLAPGQQVIVTWDGRPAQTWKGHTETVPRQVVPLGTRSVGEVLCSVENPGLELIPNVNVGVRILVREAQDAVVVPRAAVRSDDSHHVVFVVDGNHLRRVEVNVGIASATRYQVLSGVSAGQLVALPGDLDLRDGMEVRTTQVEVPE